MELSNYSFGSIQVGNKKHTSDFIVHGNWLKDWWRRSGHQVVPADLEKVINRSPARIVFGSGANGRMTLTKAAKKILDKNNINYEIHQTDKAVNKYNSYLKNDKDVAAGLHLTC
ncbi:MAG: MTH938/NDUFAF3 family protein [bacterium]